jgi:hypothetical protein
MMALTNKGRTALTNKGRIKWAWYIKLIAKRMVHHAHCEKKNGHGTPRPLQKENWPWYITPIVKRRMAKRKMAIVHHAHCERDNGHGRSRPLQNEK